MCLRWRTPTPPTNVHPIREIQIIFASLELAATRSSLEAIDFFRSINLFRKCIVARSVANHHVSFESPEVGADQAIGVFTRTHRFMGRRANVVQACGSPCRSTALGQGSRLKLPSGKTARISTSPPSARTYFVRVLRRGSERFSKADTAACSIPNLLAISTCVFCLDLRRVAKLIRPLVAMCPHAVVHVLE